MPYQLIDVLNLSLAYAAEDLLAAFTLPPNPVAPPLTSQQQSGTSVPAHQHLSSNTRGQTENKTAPAQQPACSIHSAISTGAPVWQENVRLAQEGLTLLRVILHDGRLGMVHDCKQQACQ